MSRPRSETREKVEFIILSESVLCFGSPCLSGHCPMPGRDCHCVSIRHSISTLCIIYIQHDPVGPPRFDANRHHPTRLVVIRSDPPQPDPPHFDPTKFNLTRSDSTQPDVTRSAPLRLNPTKPNTIRPQLNPTPANLIQPSRIAASHNPVAL